MPRRCNTTQGILPFTVSPKFTAGKTTPTTTEYCFAVSALPKGLLVPVSEPRTASGLTY